MQTIKDYYKRLPKKLVSNLKDFTSQYDQSPKNSDEKS